MCYTVCQKSSGTVCYFEGKTFFGKMFNVKVVGLFPGYPMETLAMTSKVKRGQIIFFGFEKAEDFLRPI